MRGSVARGAAVRVLLFVLAAGPAGANDTAIRGVGGAARAMREHSSIVMETMDVRIDLYPKLAKVRCRYRFRNTGPATTVRMGFPESGVNTVVHRQSGFDSFSTAVDGRPVRTRIEGLAAMDDSGRWQRWRVKTVRFAAHQTRNVSVRYSAPTGESSTGEQRFFVYETGTGASWKGPIGQGRVLIRGHYDPDRAWLKVPASFRRSGATSFTWTGRSFEPEPEISVTYSPGIQFTLGGRDMDTTMHPPYPYVRHGRAWAPLFLLADLLNARCEGDNSQVVLSRGSHEVRIKRGSRRMEVNGRPVLLPAAPYLDHDRYLAPAAPVAQALGATVVFDPTTRVTTLDLEFLHYLPKPPDGESGPPRGLPEGWAPPELTEFDPETRAAARQRSAAPFACLGDFNGDRHQDIALLVRTPGPQPELRVVASPGDSFGWQWFGNAGRPLPARTPPRQISFTLRTLPPGEIAMPGDGGRRVVLAHDSIELLESGRVAAVYRWDEERRQYVEENASQ